MERGSFYKRWKDWLPNVLMILSDFFVAASVVMMAISIYTHELRHINIAALVIVISSIFNYGSRRLNKNRGAEEESPFEKKRRKWLSDLLILSFLFFAVACIVMTFITIIDFQMRYVYLFCFFSFISTLSKLGSKKMEEPDKTSVEE